MRIIRNKILASLPCLTVIRLFIQRNSKPYSCSCRNSLSRVITWNKITELISLHIIKIHWYLIAPNTISVNYPITFNPNLFNLIIKGFPNHFNRTFTSGKIFHFTKSLITSTVFTNSVITTISNN